MTALVPEQLQQSWLTWHEGRERALAKPHGWLSLVGLYWLAADWHSIPGLPGQFRATADGAQFRASADDAVVDSSNQFVSGTITAEVAEDASLSWLRNGDLEIELIRRSGRLAVRLRDPAAPALAGFVGVPSYPVSESWLIAAVFTRYGVPGRITVGAAMEGLSHRHTVVGDVQFELVGHRQRLLAFGRPDGGAQLLFHDPTNGSGTAPWRSLMFNPPVDSGSVVLDFNRALNLPFAFSDFGTCPRPPVENVLTVAVTAGEKAPARRAARLHVDLQQVSSALCC